MKKVHITRKNIIALSIVFLYCTLFLLVAACVDGDNAMFNPKNPIHAFVTDALQLPNINAEYNAWILTWLFALYVLIFAIAFIFEMRIAKFYEKKALTRKWVIIYVSTFLICFALWIGISLVCQVPFDATRLNNSFIFLGESLLVSLIIGLILAAFIFSIIALIVNFKNIDKPYRYFNPNNFEDLEKENEEAIERKREEQGELKDILGFENNNTDTIISNNSEVKPAELGSTKYVFPGLSIIDDQEIGKSEDEIENTYSLNQIADMFRNYLAKYQGLYFDINTIREFIAGLATSRLIILEGLSGTGKSSIARFFSEFINEESFFDPVQASWRDRTAILGFYNDFSKKYNETPFLQRLYKMTYRMDHINLMVLDEMNIARVEYYFADFLSILEYPKDKWVLKIMQLPYGFKAPNHLIDGELHIPDNTWFIGTANKDDSTFTITDKVYDRAITISFDGRNTPFAPEGECNPINLSVSQLNELFNNAKQNESNKLNSFDFNKFEKLTTFVNDTFDITFGNRILNQIENFVPVYVSLGGTKEDALDFLFSRKIIAKLDGRFEEYIKDGLTTLLSIIDSTYGKDKFNLTRKEINKFLRKL